MAKNIKRRTCIKRVAGLAAAARLANPGQTGSAHAGDLSENGLNVYFGDLHNHNAVGYGLGSPERAFEIAHSHLDFFCFTPHAYFDTSPQNELMKTWKGFEKITNDRWPDVLALNKQYHEPGIFVTFPGYERHSSTVGHYCIIFPFDDAPLKYFGKLKDFQNHALEHGAIIVPHHPGYREGTAGAASEHWDPRVTPILEMFSEHGNAECDTAPVDYIRHSMGPRLTRRTMQAFLAQKHRIGIVASTDDHLGFPGAYGEGKAAILAPELTRESVFGALKKRRCYGVSGDRIVVDFRVNGSIMGESIPFAKKRTISALVKGWDRIDRVEVLKNNRVIHCEIPSEPELSPRLLNKPFLVKVEYGWGPMGENQIPLDRIPKVYDWDYTLSLTGAKMTELQLCIQSAPLAEDKRHRITGKSASGFSLSSYTSRQRCLFNRDTHSIVMRVNGSPSDILSIDFRAPKKDKLSVKLSDILSGDESIKIKSNSLKIHRIVPESATKASFTIGDSGSGDSTDWYYVRVVQKNGQLAWSSPIWVEKRG